MSAYSDWAVELLSGVAAGCKVSDRGSMPAPDFPVIPHPGQYWLIWNKFIERKISIFQ